jgi:hypothetical protein
VRKNYLFQGPWVAGDIFYGAVMRSTEVGAARGSVAEDLAGWEVAEELVKLA